MSRIFLSLGGIGLASALAVGVGCGDERPPASDTLVPGTTFASVGTVDAGAATDASSACASVAVEGSGISETFVNAETPPDPLGGTLPSGTFVLTDVSRFESWAPARDGDGYYIDPPPSSDLLEAKVLVVDGASYRFAVRTGTLDGGLESDVEISGGTIVAKGTNAVFSQSCPTRAAFTLGYTGIGGSIAIYTDAKRRETYAPLPP